MKPIQKKSHFQIRLDGISSIFIATLPAQALAFHLCYANITILRQPMQTLKSPIGNPVDSARPRVDWWDKLPLPNLVESG
jgi:hypothetical protein